MSRCNLIEGKLSKMYWVRAMATANYTLNRITNEKTKKSPFELCFGKKPDLTKLRVFGCTVFMQKRKQQRSKLEPRGVKCKFLGYEDCSPSYVVQEIDSGKIHFARNTIFNENEIPSSHFGGDRVVRSDDDSIIDIFEKIAERKANEISTNQEKVETTNSRTYAQDEDQSDEVESLVNDQALFEVCNVATMSQVVKEETEGNDIRTHVLRTDLTSMTVKLFSEDKLLDVYPVKT